MRTSVIIPARGGSKGIPGKNIKSLLGKPLILYSIEDALRSESVDGIYVTTDDQAIAEIGAQAGADIITRPESLSGDTATTESAVEHALSVIPQDRKPDNIILLQPTSPLRPAGAIDKACRIFSENRFDSLLSISPTHRFFWKTDGKLAVPEYDYMNRPRRQDIKEEDIRYVENGSLYIFSHDNFKRTKNRLGGRIGYIIFPEKYSYEIDSVYDFRFLEILMNEINQGS